MAAIGEIALTKFQMRPKSDVGFATGATDGVGVAGADAGLATGVTGREAGGARGDTTGEVLDGTNVEVGVTFPVEAGVGTGLTGSAGAATGDATGGEFAAFLVSSAVTFATSSAGVSGRG